MQLCDPFVMGIYLPIRQVLMINILLTHSPSPMEVREEQKAFFAYLSYLPVGSTEHFGGYLAVLVAPYHFSLLLGRVNLYPG